MKDKNYKGMIWPVDHDKKLKYIKMGKIPRFDFHPDYPDHEVFVITNNKGEPAKNAKLQYFQQIRFGRLLYSTSIIETGDLDLLRGKAAVYYHERRKQFERTMIKEFKKYDVFHNEKDTIGIAVHTQKDGYVYYYKYKVENGIKARFWQVTSSELRKMPVHKFALSILKINPERYADLIPPELIVERKQINDRKTRI